MKIDTISMERIRPFEGSPFKVRLDDAMDELIKSIKENGVLTPLALRELNDGNYEIICGNRRYKACELAGLTEVPAIIYEVSRDEAIIRLVDDNLTQRADILPSEKALAYKMKLEALNRQGRRTDLTLSQVGKKLNSYEEVAAAADTSRSQVHRYVRLTKLDPELLEMVDEKKIAIGPAVELSYLTKDEQADLIETIKSEDATPSISQAQRMRRLSEKKSLDMDSIFDVMTEVKGNQVEMVKIPADLVRKRIDGFISYREIQDLIERAIDYYFQHLIRQRERDDRDAR